jgi:transcriptional antiterminator RfaH
MNQWYALHAKPRQEHQVGSFLSTRGIETYLPERRALQKRAGRKIRVVQPLFPCYLFAYLDLDVVGVSAVRWTPGLRDLVTFGEQPAVVEPGFIAQLKFRIGQGEIQRQLDRPRFARGDRVRVRGGPLADLDAVFQGTLPGNLRAAILINILGRMARAEVDSDDLEPRSTLHRPARLS